ncbi:MAG TPA: hypothetical protein VER12_03040 [Polyangiaceae bacterium]|nr:hypothetical protein [Polyangiaceae bacterium]
MQRAYASLVGFVAATVLVGASGCSVASADASSEQSSESEVSIATSELGVNGLTPKQARTALGLIDDICGDTWCEGDHNFRFDHLECTRPCGRTPGTCRLAFRIFPHDSQPSTGPSYARTCKTTGFTGFSSLVDTAQNGYQSLNWQFYDSLSACISRLEEQLPPT